MSEQPYHDDGVWYSRSAPTPEETEQQQQQAAAQAQAAQQALPPPPPRLMLPDLQEIEQAASRMVIGRAPVQPAPPPATQAQPRYDPATYEPGSAAYGAATAEPAARRLAAPAVIATPLAAPSAVTAVRQDDGNPPPAEDGELSAEARTGPSGRMTRLHLGWHAVKRSTLASVSLPSSGSGLVLGHDRQQIAVPIRLFAPEPVRIALVGGVWAAQLVIFRALALGARVAVITSEPAAWVGFGERATGQYNRLTVLSDDQAVPSAGTAQQPVLAVYDLREGRPVAAPALGPWRSQLTILRQLDRPGVPALQEAQMTLMQRLGGEEASLAASALRLRSHSGQFLQFMADDMMALVADGTDRYLSLSQTRTEHDQVGPPRR
jgi:hypothetical protein